MYLAGAVSCVLPFCVTQVWTACRSYRWGDALYAKGEYDAAMVQYSETLGYLEPSYVIR